MTLISVVICTYNRCDLLEQVLKTLIEQTLFVDQFEVIVVDNNSKDKTSEFVKCFSSENSKITIRYFLETKQGLSHARNRGWTEAKGEYVAYTDDDCKAPKQWLEVAKRIIEKHSPGIFGGPFYPFYSSSKPKWFKDAYGSQTLGDNAHSMEDSEFVNGGNIFFRRSLLKEIGGFDPKLGMVGNKIAYGEETALQIYVRKSMPSEIIYYDPELYVYHLVRPEKMSLKWRFSHSFSTGRYSYLVFGINENSKYKKIGKSPYLFLATLNAILRTPLRDRKQYPYLENYIDEIIFPRVITFGMLYEQLIQENNLKKKKNL